MEIKRLQNVHDHTVKDLKSRSSQLELEIVHKKDGIVKLKSQMTRMQVILRKNNLALDTSLSGNMKTVIESLQQTILQKEEKIKALISQISRLQTMPVAERSRLPILMVSVDEDEVLQKSDFDVGYVLPDFMDFARINNDRPLLGSSTSRRVSTVKHLLPGSTVREKRASISLKGMQSMKRESTHDCPLPAITIKETLQDKLLKITEKFEMIISAEKSKHDAEIKVIMNRIQEQEEIGMMNFNEELEFSKKRLPENRHFQKYSFEMLKTIQGLFPIRIPSSKVSSYTQCNLDDFI